MDGTQVGAGTNFGAPPASWQPVTELGETLNGDSGVNTLYGTVGRDTLYGKDGNDTLRGGTGTDRFVFDTAPNTLSNKDSVSDFTPNSDTLVLSEVIYTSPPQGQL